MSRTRLVICLLAVLQLSSPSAARRSCNHGRRCGLIRFLQDVLKARDDLSWIDQKAAQMRSKDAYLIPQLQDNINAMFLIDTGPIHQYSNENSQQLRQRSKRFSNDTTTSTTDASLKKLLASVNVFPVEDVPHPNNTETHVRIGRSLKAINPSQFRSENSRAVYGDLAKEIVEEIMTQVKNKENTEGANNNPLHPEILKSFVMASLDEAEPSPDKDGGDTFSITQKLIDKVRLLISEQVEKKSCVPLPPDLEKFLQYLLSVNDKNVLKTKTQVKKSAEYTSDLDEWYGKNKILNDLLDEYDILTRREKNKVQAIYEYLVSRHNFVESCIDAFHTHRIPIPK